MNRTTFAVITTAMLMATGGAFAQDAAKRAEEIRSSSEAMKPITNNPTTGTPSPAQPLSAAEKQAEEARRSSELMKPQTNAPASTGNAMATPLSPADQKTAAEQSRSEMMKPK